MNTQENKTEIDQLRLEIKKEKKVSTLFFIIIFIFLVYITYMHLKKQLGQEQISIVDKSGKIRILLTVDEFDDAPTITFYDKKLIPKIIISLDEHGSPGMIFKRGNKLQVLKKDAFKTIHTTPVGVQRVLGTKKDSRVKP